METPVRKRFVKNSGLWFAGGDGTVGWILGCLGELNKKERLPIPPTGVIPLGTGNDLSRSFGWGGSFPFNWKSAIKRTLEKVSKGPIVNLDSSCWRKAKKQTSWSEKSSLHKRYWRYCNYTSCCAKVQKSDS